MRDAETTLTIVKERGKKGLSLENVYRRLYNRDLYLAAYGRIYRNAGSMTRGATDETVDGMSLAKIDAIIESLRYERYRWTPVRRVLIPKSNGKTRPLGIPTWTDRLVQEVMRSILDAYYDPQFSTASHGFRHARGCHTALKHIFCAWNGTRWFIEGDIKGCFDNIDHTIMLSILREKIHDNRFLTLVENLLKAGFLEEWYYKPTLSGTPQGGIISPLLSNIYLDRLDQYVEKTLVPEYTKGKRRKANRDYGRITSKIMMLRKEGATTEELKPLLKEQHSLCCSDMFDPDYRRLRFIRYADDFLLGFIGPKNEAEEIKGKIGDFLRDSLKLEMSPEKTLITHAGTEKARFLGYDIGTRPSPQAKRANGSVRLRLPIQKLREKIARYRQDGTIMHRTELMHDSDFTIISRYGSEYAGIVQYYAYAENRYWLHRLEWVMETSMLKTLAAKHKSSVAKMAHKYQFVCYHDDQRYRCFMATVDRPGKDPLYAYFGGLSLSPDPRLDIEDSPINLDRYYSRSELLERLLADTCEECGSKDNVEVHHIRKLSDLNVPGRKAKPEWFRTMIARRRKTMVLCRVCHTNLHAGRPMRKRVETGTTN